MLCLGILKDLKMFFMTSLNIFWFIINQGVFRTLSDICDGAFRDCSFSMYAKFSEKLAFVTPWYTHVRMHIMG